MVLEQVEPVIVKVGRIDDSAREDTGVGHEFALAASFHHEDLEVGACPADAITDDKHQAGSLPPVFPCHAFSQ